MPYEPLPVNPKYHGKEHQQFQEPRLLKVVGRICWIPHILGLAQELLCCRFRSFGFSSFKFEVWDVGLRAWGLTFISAVSRDKTFS